MASKMFGVRQYRAALKRLPEDLKDEVRGAITKTVTAVHAKGKANIASMTKARTGRLLRLYRKGVPRTGLTGRVGYLSAASRREVFYARFVHDGTVKMQARPFHQNAVEAERELDTQRMVRARDDALRKASLRR